VPYSIVAEKHLYKQKEIIHYSSGGKQIVFRPNYLSYSNITKWNRKFSTIAWWKAFHKGLSWIDNDIDVVYCHFWQSMKAGMLYARTHNLPLFVANGESKITNLYPNYNEERDLQEQVKGVICVSTKCKEESISLGLVKENNCIVAPNAINNLLFRKLNKLECRRKLNIPQSSFIVISVGSFIERKGMNRIAQAIDSLDEKIYSVFVGKGLVEPNCKNILFKGALPHHEIPIYLNSADVFVLPTLNEGCCNAVIEAMACGLPIISSNLPFNWDVLNESNSILVDPNSIVEISQSIKTLHDNEKLRESC
jgi:glycosyltransferase involved in cell wall biosynthesis